MNVISSHCKGGPWGGDFIDEGEAGSKKPLSEERYRRIC